MHEREVKVERSQEDLFGRYHFIAQVPVLLRTTRESDMREERNDIHNSVSGSDLF
jgi:hypothetical protein